MSMRPITGDYATDTKIYQTAAWLLQFSGGKWQVSLDGYTFSQLAYDTTYPVTPAPVTTTLSAPTGELPITPVSTIVPPRPEILPPPLVYPTPLASPGVPNTSSGWSYATSHAISYTPNANNGNPLTTMYTNYPRDIYLVGSTDYLDPYYLQVSTGITSLLSSPAKVYDSGTTTWTINNPDTRVAKYVPKLFLDNTALNQLAIAKEQQNLLYGKVDVFMDSLGYLSGQFEPSYATTGYNYNFLEFNQTWQKFYISKGNLNSTKLAQAYEVVWPRFDALFGKVTIEAIRIPPVAPDTWAQYNLNTGNSNLTAGKYNPVSPVAAISKDFGWYACGNFDQFHRIGIYPNKQETPAFKAQDAEVRNLVSFGSHVAYGLSTPVAEATFFQVDIAIKAATKMLFSEDSSTLVLLASTEDAANDYVSYQGDWRYVGGTTNYVYVYKYNGTSWTQAYALTIPTQPNTIDITSWSVSGDGNTVALGCTTCYSNYGIGGDTGGGRGTLFIIRNGVMTEHPNPIVSSADPIRWWGYAHALNQDGSRLWVTHGGTVKDLKQYSVTGSGATALTLLASNHMSAVFAVPAMEYRRFEQIACSPDGTTAYLYYRGRASTPDWETHETHQGRLYRVTQGGQPSIVGTFAAPYGLTTRLWDISFASNTFLVKYVDAEVAGTVTNYTVWYEVRSLADGSVLREFMLPGLYAGFTAYTGNGYGWSGNQDKQDSTTLDSTGTRIALVLGGGCHILWLWDGITPTQYAQNISAYQGGSGGATVVTRINTSLSVKNLTPEFENYVNTMIGFTAKHPTLKVGLGVNIPTTPSTYAEAVAALKGYPYVARQTYKYYSGVKQPMPLSEVELSMATGGVASTRTDYTTIDVKTLDVVVHLGFFCDEMVIYPTSYNLSRPVMILRGKDTSIEDPLFIEGVLVAGSVNTTLSINEFKLFKFVIPFEKMSQLISNNEGYAEKFWLEFGFYNSTTTTFDNASLLTFNNLLIKNLVYDTFWNTDWITFFRESSERKALLPPLERLFGFEGYTNPVGSDVGTPLANLLPREGSGYKTMGGNFVGFPVATSISHTLGTFTVNTVANATLCYKKTLFKECEYVDPTTFALSYVPYTPITSIRVYRSTPTGATPTLTANNIVATATDWSLTIKGTGWANPSTALTPFNDTLNVMSNSSLVDSSKTSLVSILNMTQSIPSVGVAFTAYPVAGLTYQNPRGYFGFEVDVSFAPKVKLTGSTTAATVALNKRSLFIQFMNGTTVVKQITVVGVVA